MRSTASRKQLSRLTRQTWSVLRRLLPDQRGNALMVAAAAFPLLIGGVGLAVDGVEWVLQKREIQAAADAAAMAGVYGLIQQQDMQNAVSDSLARAGSVPANAAIQTEQSPPGHEKDPFAVAVHVTVPAKMTFAGMFLSKPPVITADATASVVQTGDFCAFALGQVDDSGVVIRPASNVEMDCGVASNSTSNKAALQADSSSSLKAPRVAAFGGIQGNGAIDSNRIRDHALMQQDPFEDSTPPQVPNTGCPNVTINADQGQETALQPGCYATMYLNGNVRLQDGEYILNKGDFVVGEQGHVSCDACTIFLTSETAATDPGSIGRVVISSDANVKMGATRDGPNAGILFYQDRRAVGGENRVGGGSLTKLSGLLYFPSETLYLDGNMSPDLQCTRLLAKRLVFAGRVYISKKCDDLGRMIFAGSEVRLIA